MGGFIGKILVTAVAALIVAWILPGVQIHDSVTAILVAFVLALLNGFIKPLLILLTIPITIITLGLFLLVINIVIIRLAADIVPGFHVNGAWSALWFSLLLSFVTSIIEGIIGRPDGRER